MTFLHPWAIALGVLAAGLPVLIHFLTRPRPVRLPLSTIRFVREAVHQRRARHRLRDFIILTLRTIAVLLIGWAVARPLIGRQAVMAAEEGGDVARVVIVDVSQSMAAEAHGVQLFERARSTAATHLSDQLGLQANLIVGGANARPIFERFSTNYGALREELARLKPRPERLNVAAALHQAGEMLARAGDRRKELVVVSDFQRSNWAAADFTPLPQDAIIQLESVASPEPLANLAVLRVAPQGRVEQGREVRLEIEIGNYSATARQVQVEVAIGDAAYRAEGVCAAGDKTVLATVIQPRAPGWQMGEARMIGVQDALPADNSRSFAFEVRPAPTFALITKQRADQRPSSSYYVERALVPFMQRPDQAGSKVVRHDPGHLDRDALATADAIVLDHPGKLANEDIQLLTTFLRRGRGIFYVTAEPTDAANLKLLMDAAGSALQMPVEFTPPTGGQRRRDLFLTEVRRDRPPFSIFGDNVPTVVGSLRFNGGLASHRLDNGLADDVLASYQDRSACLVTTSCGAGVLAILNADLGTSNLPSSPAFVPLLGELMDRLLGQSRSVEAMVSGEPLAVYLPAAAGPSAGLQLIGPERSAEAIGQLAEESGGVLWSAPAAPAPGIYQVRRGDATVFALATGLPLEESDLRPLDPTIFKDRLAGGRTVLYRSATGEEEERDDFWTWLVLGCVLCLLSELVALRIFRT